MFIYVANSDFTSGKRGGSPKDALSVFDFDETTGAFKHVQTLGDVRNPTYLARHPKLPVVYAIERWINPDRSPTTPEQQKGDCVSSFAIDPANGTLSLIGRGPTGGLSPMHVNVHPSGRFAAFANPGLPTDPDPASGHVTVIELGENGAPGKLCASVKFEGRSPVWRHRPKPYPHSVFADPGRKRLFSCFLMLDRVLIYRFDEKTGALTPSEQPYAQTSSGAGPRHMAFHPSGRFFYTINEFDATVSAFAHDTASGAVAIIQTISIQPADFDGKKSGAHVMVGPGGRFLYCSNRSHQSIAIFAIDQKTGELTLVGHRKTLGARPRDFNFDPSGRFLLVANQHGNTMVSFHVDPDTGDLRPTGHSVESHSANCIVFGPA